MDSCSKFEEYAKLAKKQGMKAIAVSNHGGIYDWIKKKQTCDKLDLKYIHGVELYLCEELIDDDRGSHIGLYAKNLMGVKELNTLVSIATSKGKEEDNSDRHMYYNPRISLQELVNTSDNIIVTTACLASPLNRWRGDKQDGLVRLVKWLTQNKHRCFLEVQYHNNENQIKFNKQLHAISIKTGIPLIAGTDTHSSSKYKAECRKILQKSKDSYYGEEDEFDLTWKSYNELVDCFKNQKALPQNVYMQAIQNTNILANMIEDFALDKTLKYPTLYGDTTVQQWRDLIFQKLKEKKKNGVLDLKNHSVDEYKARIIEEFQIMKKLGMESFMMFMSELADWCLENDIPYGTGRGSVAGSLIAYITDITDVDPIVWKTVFSRFCNEDRVSLADIDADFAPEDRESVYQYISSRLSHNKTARITTFPTLQIRGCIDTLALGLEYHDLAKVADIKNQHDVIFDKYSKIVQSEVDSEGLVEERLIDTATITFDNYEVYRQRILTKESELKKFDKCKAELDKLIETNQDLFYYLDGLKGTIVAKGSHPSGMIGSPITLANNMGVYYKDGDASHAISACSMKAVDSLNYVKFDILGLKTVGIIKDACKYIGIPYPKAHLMNWKDEKVWENMIKNKQGCFQFEGDYAFDLLKTFKPTTINHMSMVNAALRPSGKSYRDRLIEGEFNANPSEEIDNLLEENNGFLIFQEDTIKFLIDICGFSGSKADTTRRNIGKKNAEALRAELPDIIEGYCNHSSRPRVMAEEEAKQFVQIIQDSSDYQFGYNHSTAYSMNGYICMWLRTYYPLEFLAAYANRAENEEDINNTIDLADAYKIQIHPIEFGKSLSQYTIDYDNNAVYKGIKSIKFCNETIAEELMELSENQYGDFASLIKDIQSKTSVNSRQMTVLTGLNYFSRYGNNKYLLQITDIYNKLGSVKQIKKDKLEELGLNEFLIRKYSKKETEKLYRELDNVGLINELCKSIENKPMGVIEFIKFEMEYLGYTTYKNLEVSEYYYVVIGFKTYADATKPYLTLRQIKTGKEIKTKIKQGKIFKEQPFGEYNILKIHSFKEVNKTRKVNGDWVKVDEMEQILTEYEVMK